MPKGFEQFDRGTSEKGPDYPKNFEKEPGIKRRDFIKGLGILALGGAAVGLGIEKISKKETNYWDVVLSEIPEEKGLEVDEKHIEAEDLSTIINYDLSAVRLEPHRISNLKEYWKMRYSDPKDPNNLNQRSKKALEDMRPFDADLKRSFSNHGNPPELRYISIVESDFKDYARSHAGAVGHFQFMLKTAREYGLKVDPPRIDERRDPLKSGRAASRFLRDLFTETQDRKLALSAYNGGYVLRYLKEERGEPSYDKFLKFLENEINSLKLSIKESRYEHTVLREQTLWQIAKRYDVSVADIEKANHDVLGQGKILRSGSKLKIPFRDEAHKRKIFYKLTRGFRENIDFPHRVMGLIGAIKEGKI